MRMLRAWFAIPLWQRVLGGLALGLLLALVWPEAAPSVAFRRGPTQEARRIGLRMGASHAPRPAMRVTERHDHAAI